MNTLDNRWSILYDRPGIQIKYGVDPSDSHCWIKIWQMKKGLFGVHSRLVLVADISVEDFSHVMIRH